MSTHLADERGETFRYLSRADVRACCAGLNVVGVATDALAQHARGQVVLPAEAHLGWTTPDGFAARCLAMPAALLAGGRPVVGLKTINASLGNTGRGLPRSQGLTMLLDPETARSVLVLEAAHVSALRTAAVSAVAVGHLARPGAGRLAVIGCGVLAEAHLALLTESWPGLRQVGLFDAVPGRAEELAGSVWRRWPDLGVAVAADARGCVEGADVVVPVTTTTTGYLPLAWLRPGTLVVHVSLDDLLPDVVLGAGLVLVDDWSLVRADERRLFGRMYRAGHLTGPADEPQPRRPRPGAGAPFPRAVDATLGDVLVGRHPGRPDPDAIVVVNPFGMAILDVAIAEQVRGVAEQRDIGLLLPL